MEPIRKPIPALALLGRPLWDPRNYWDKWSKGGHVRPPGTERRFLLTFDHSADVLSSLMLGRPCEGDSNDLSQDLPT
jgi:hypothetical protein